MGMLMNDRRKSRLGLKVIHKHRVGDKLFRRVSELVVIDGRPKAILSWINLGDVRTPIYLCDLDHAKLRRSPSDSSLFFYDDVTVDPRFEALGPSPRDGDLPASVA
jgi:hypothetical protein